MARDRKQTGVYVPKPKPDVYVALIIVTFIATLIATLIMWYENSLLQ